MVEGQIMAGTGQGRKRTTAAAPETAGGQKAPKASRKQGSGHVTSLDIPHYVMDQIREYLTEHRDIKFKHMVLLGFTKLGIKVEPEDLKPERQRGVS